MKIGLYGGSFDPIHEGHMALVRGMAAALSLDRVILMPTGMPPHKIKATDTSDEHRLAMCRLAAEGDARITVSDYEIRKGGASFTIDTLEALAAENPSAEWFLLMGADMFLSLASWKRVEDIAKIATLCGVPREGVTVAEMQAYAQSLAVFGADCRVVDLPLKTVSSTQIREAVQNDAPLDGLVPPRVEAYIRANGLYRETVAVDRDEQYKAIIKARLTPQRYYHSLCVADEARRLSVTMGADPQKAYTAGLLHDILKNTNPDRQLQILKDFGILLDTVEKQSPKLWHAKSGAVFIERVLGVKDAEIVSAVRYHTTARVGMTPLERVLFLADFTSADRDYEDVDVMRRLVDEDPDEAMVYALSYTVRELAAGNSLIHPDTIGAYNELVLKRSVDYNGKGQTE